MTFEGSDRGEEAAIAEIEAAWVVEREQQRTELHRTNPVVATLKDAEDKLVAARSIIAHSESGARRDAMLAAMEKTEVAFYDTLHTIREEQSRLTVEQLNELPEDFREFVLPESLPQERTER